MAVKESTEQALQRWAELEFVQREYSEFAPFLADVMNLLGFKTSPMQFDIGAYITYGPQYSMVQAQRGQAKTTIAAAAAVWSLIHNPQWRVLIISAGGKQANEISTLIVRIIGSMDMLECMRPDAANGDRTSVEAYDLHYSLKGIDKSPSVACTGVTGNLQGKRADFLIADDIESVKNARTATMRELLMELSRDFTSICSTGKILYLGTPQSIDSIYNTLPGRGYTIRIWPGRYPTQAKIADYGDMLAPYIRSRLERDVGLQAGGGLMGDQGQPTDPTYINEFVLQAKEADQGPSYFQLQHMLNTALADAARFPLKLQDIIMMPLGTAASEQTRYPMAVSRGIGVGTKDITVHSTPYKLSMAGACSDEYAGLQGTIMYIDPAGGGKNGDETAYAVTGFLNGNIYVLAAGGIPGGYGIEQMRELASIAKRWSITKAIVEKNMGYGAFTVVWLPVLREVHQCSVEEDMVTGQKELRIIETLEPIIARGSLIMNEAIVETDTIDTAKYPADHKTIYSLFHQISKITRERECLIHDDRVDALEGACRFWAAQLAINQTVKLQAQRKAEWEKSVADPMGRNRYSNTGPTNPRFQHNMLNRITRRY
jgi:hypothetical protein